MNNLRKMTIVLFSTLATIFFYGCASYNEIHKMMKNYEFKSVTPPQTKWEVGSIVEHDKSISSSPIFRSTPNSIGIEVYYNDHKMPEVSIQHEEKLSLSSGISLPDSIKLKLSANGVSKYSVITKGNFIRRILLDNYLNTTLQEMAKKVGDNWEPAIREGKLYSLYELWFAEELVHLSGDSPPFRRLMDVLYRST